MSPSRQIRAGLRRHRARLLSWFLEGLGAIWLVVQAASYFSHQIRDSTEDQPWLLLAGIAGSALGAIWRALEPTSVAIPLKNTSTEVTVRFGNLFDAQDDHLAIPVNESFDGELGLPIDPKSVHGQFIARAFNGSKRDFETACDDLLPKASAEQSGRTARKRVYPIGTTVALPLQGRRAFLFALSRTDPCTLKAKSDLPTMWMALAGLWQAVRVYSNGHPISLPLVGAGQSGVALEPKHLLRLILLSILVATRDGEVCKRINIVLRDDLFEKVDLQSVKNEWS